MMISGRSYGSTDTGWSWREFAPKIHPQYQQDHKFSRNITIDLAASGHSVDGDEASTEGAKNNGVDGVKVMYQDVYQDIIEEHGIQREWEEITNTGMSWLKTNQEWFIWQRCCWYVYNLPEIYNLKSMVHGWTNINPIF